MFEFSAFILIGILGAIMALRKATVVSSNLANNAGSFVNVTAERLHIRLLDFRALPESDPGVSGDSAIGSIDEVPIDQSLVNDSRSHIMAVSSAVAGGSGAIEGTTMQKTMVFNRNDLVLDPDEALFMNLTDVSGAMGVTFSLNVWYED